MNQATTHTHLSTTGSAPVRPLIARIAALVLLAVLVALTVESFFTTASAQTPTRVAPPLPRQSEASLCRQFPKAHFVFIDAKVTPAVASTCTTDMLSV